MTWKEFKEFVEKEGIKDEDEILNIDTGTYPEDLIVSQNETDNMFSVWA